MHKNLHVIGISGVTNSGKTSLSAFIDQMLQFSYEVVVLNQDDYIKLQDPRMCGDCGNRFMSSKLCEGTTIKNKYHNWETLTVFDMESFWAKIQEEINASLLKGKKKIIIIEGFMVFEDERIVQICDLRFFLTLDFELCKCRRSKRNYEPGDPEEYFEKCVWPAYLEYFNGLDVKISDLVMIDGGKFQHCQQKALKHIEDKFK